MSHTPGPWEWSREGGWPEGRDLLHPTGELTGDDLVLFLRDDDNGGVGEDDLRLIAAAPDLLEAAENFRWRFGGGHQDSQEYKALVAAIDKATGTEVPA